MKVGEGVGALFVQMLFDEPRFDLLACPGCFAQKRKTGFYARIELETPDWDATPHLAPTMPLDKLIEDAFQGDAMQGIAGMRRRRCHGILLLEAFVKGFASRNPAA